MVGRPRPRAFRDSLGPSRALPKCLAILLCFVADKHARAGSWFRPALLPFNRRIASALTGLYLLESRLSHRVHRAVIVPSLRRLAPKVSQVQSPPLHYVRDCRRDSCHPNESDDFRDLCRSRRLPGHCSHHPHQGLEAGWPGDSYLPPSARQRLGLRHLFGNLVETFRRNQGFKLLWEHSDRKGASWVDLRHACPESEPRALVEHDCTEGGAGGGGFFPCTAGVLAGGKSHGPACWVDCGRATTLFPPAIPRVYEPAYSTQLLSVCQRPLFSNGG